MVMVCIPLVVGDICEDMLDIGENCTMITPDISCSLNNYSIINESGSIITQNNLTLLNGSIYYFIFNETSGGYLIELCDGSTREMVVQEENEMIYLTLALIFMFFTGLLVISLFNVEKPWLKVSLSIALSILITTLVRFSSWFVTIVSPNETELIATLDRFYLFGVWGMRITITFAVFFVTIMILNAITRMSKGRHKDKFDDFEDW